MTVKMPKVSDTVNVVVIADLLCEPGASVAEGQPVLSVDADKAFVEVPAPVKGVVVEFFVQPDDEVETGAPLFVVEWS